MPRLGSAAARMLRRVQAVVALWRWNQRERAVRPSAMMSAPGLPEPVRPDPEPYPWSTDPADADPADAMRALAEHDQPGGPCEDRTPLELPPAGGRISREGEIDSSRYVTRLDGVD